MRINLISLPSRNIIEEMVERLLKSTKKCFKCEKIIGSDGIHLREILDRLQDEEGWFGHNEITVEAAIKIFSIALNKNHHCFLNYCGYHATPRYQLAFLNELSKHIK